MRERGLRKTRRLLTWASGRRKLQSPELREAVVRVGLWGREEVCGDERDILDLHHLCTFTQRCCTGSCLFESRIKEWGWRWDINLGVVGIQMIFKTWAGWDHQVSEFRQRKGSITKIWGILVFRRWIEKEEAAKEAEKSHRETVPGECGILGTKWRQCVGEVGAGSRAEHHRDWPLLLRGHWWPYREQCLWTLRSNPFLVQQRVRGGELGSASIDNCF